MEEVIKGYPNYQGLLLGNGTITTFGNLFRDINKEDNEEEFFVWTTSKKGKSKKIKVVEVKKTGKSNNFLQVLTTDGFKFYTLENNEVLTKSGYKKVKDLTVEDELVCCDFYKKDEPVRVRTISLISYVWEEDLYSLTIEGGNNIALLGGVSVHI